MYLLVLRQAQDERGRPVLILRVPFVELRRDPQDERIRWLGTNEPKRSSFDRLRTNGAENAFLGVESHARPNMTSLPTITLLQKQKRRPRVDVHLDGEYAFSVDVALAVERGLARGQGLDAMSRRELEAEDQRRGAIAAALRLLATAPRSEKDLRDRLRRRGFRRDGQDAAVSRMRELGYLDDAAFARLYVESRQAATPRSRRALAFELKRKGVDAELVVDSLEPVSDADAAYEAAQRRLRALQKLDRQTFVRRLSSFLASRGFSYGVTRGVVDRCWLQVSAEVEETQA